MKVYVRLLLARYVENINKVYPYSQFVCRSLERNICKALGLICKKVFQTIEGLHMIDMTFSMIFNPVKSKF